MKNLTLILAALLLICGSTFADSYWFDHRSLEVAVTSLFRLNRVPKLAG